MYEVAIIDDRRADAEELRDLLHMCACADELSFALYDSAEAFEAAVHAGASPSVIFVDICLDGTVEAGGGSRVSGIDVVERLVAGTGAQVVYMSAYDAYHTQVYRTLHACYLRKPFVLADVAAAWTLVVDRLGQASERPIRLRANGVEHMVRPHDIRYLESDLRRVRVHMRDGVLEVYGKLSELQCMLPSRFSRCHQSFLVNLDYVECLEASGLRLVGGEEIPVSRRHRAEVREALIAHVRAGR